ncbi:MAG: HD domain-containing protein [Clostridiaceae bacterium]
MNIIILLKKYMKLSLDEIYIVGGYVRDKELGIKSDDLDFTVKGNIENLMEYLKNNGIKYHLVNEENSIYRIKYQDQMFDFSKIKGENIEEDLNKRDFTINSMAYSIKEDKLIDPFNGKDDINNKLVKQVNSFSLKEDPIRILRAIRLVISFNMNIEFNTGKDIKIQIKNIKKCKKERLFNEFMKIIHKDQYGCAFKVLDQYDALKYIVPYSEENKTIGKCKYHIEDAYTHMNLVYENFKKLYLSEIKLNGFDRNYFKRRIGDFNLCDFASLACFLHDIGKYKCYNKTEEKITFYGHDIVGSDIALGFLSDFGFPKSMISYISILIRGHMQPLMIYKNRGKDNKKYFYKFFKKYDKLSYDIFAISFCDVYSTRMLKDEENEILVYKKFIENAYKEYNIYSGIRQNKLIKSQDVINLTNAKGVRIKEILDEIDKLRYFNKINNSEDIIEYLKKLK